MNYVAAGESPDLKSSMRLRRGSHSGFAPIDISATRDEQA